MNARTYVDRADPPALALGPPDIIVAWNKAMTVLTGHGTAEALGASIAKLLAPRDIYGNPYTWPTRGLSALLESGRPLWPFEVDLCKAAGTYVRVRCCSVVFVSPRGTPEVAQVLDVQRRRRRADVVLDWLLKNTEEAPLSLIASARPDRDTSHQAHHTLSRRQLEVLHLLARGAVTKEVAVELDLSVHTVRAHLRALFKALGVNSQREAVIAAYRKGLI